MINQVTLYIATHNITGLKYFGKTERYFTLDDIQENYSGSGVYWKNHLKKHGDDVTMEIYGIFLLDEVENIALKFSTENKIVESNEWANLRPENGLAGMPIGGCHSEETKLKMSITQTGKESPLKGMPLSEEHCRNISNGKTGKIYSEDHRYNISESLKGREIPLETRKKLSESSIGITKTEEHCRNISDARMGMEFSESHKENISNALKNKPKEKVTCPYCNKSGGKPIMNRYHFDKCKNKNKV